MEATLSLFPGADRARASAEDRYRAMDMLKAVGAIDHDLNVYVHEGEPASKARARVVKGHAYTPAKTAAAQRSLADRFGGLVFDGNVAVACVFHRGNRQRIDIDNLVKLVLDAATQAGVWQDDSQVTAVVGILEHDRDFPRTVVAFANHESSMARGPNSKPKCKVCGTLYNNYGDRRRQHCSRECRMTLANPVRCPTCDQLFKKIVGSQKYCSVECRGLAQRRRPVCECGARVSRKGYKRCRKCWLEKGPEVAA